MSYNYLTEVPVNNNTVHTIRSLSLDHPDNLFIRGFKLEADIHELEDLLNEVIIRFDTNPDNYLKDDYMHLIALLYRNFLVIKGFNDRVDGVDQIINDLDVRITKNEGDINNLDIKITKNEGDINNLDIKITKNESDINNLDVRITKNEGDIRDLDIRIIKNEGDIVNTNNTILLLSDITVKSTISIKHSELLDKVKNGSLLPGLDYRITDYVFTTTLSSSSSALKPFDIIVTATSTNTLSEDARAIKRENDTHYTGVNLDSWDIKYTIYNNKNLYSWADDVNGKGVIYYMKDEFNNEAGYDFLNALFNGKFTFTKCSNVSITFSKSLPFNVIVSGYDVIIRDSVCNNIDSSTTITIEGGSYNNIKACRNIEMHLSSHNNFINNINIQCYKVEYVKNNNSIRYSTLSNMEHVNLESTKTVLYKTIDNVKNTTITFCEDFIDTPELIRQGSKIITFID